MFSTRFIAATKEYSTLEKRVPAPYLRRTFEVSGAVKAAKLTVCGLGFYELFINGRRLTKGLIAPYVSNPDDILYYDEYDVTAELRAGRNALGLLLGNGMLNCPGGQIWDLQLTRYRSAPKAALALQIETEDGEKICIEADEAFRCAPSPILYDDLRAGEWYDARREIPGWNLPEFDDGDWSPVLPAETPRGECRLCQAEPIVTTHELTPVEVRRGRLRDGDYVHPGLPVIPMEGVEAEKSGWLYDFGVNAAGLCRLKIKGKPGQKIVLQFAETLDENGEVDLRGMSFLPAALDHRDVYICKGEGEEVYTPSFTYHGFRYCLALGLEDEQATPDLLTYQVMNSDLAVRGDFTSSSETLNRLQQATRVSDLANFYYFPTDCPHREKNGWTADAALSAEHMLLNFAVETSYREWLRNICKAQRDDGALPGIVPKINLRGNDHLIAGNAFPERLSQIFLARPGGIAVGRIEEIDSQIERMPDHGFSGAFVQRPVVHRPCLAKAHAAHADPGNFNLRPAQLRVFHSISPFTRTGSSFPRYIRSFQSLTLILGRI